MSVFRVNPRHSRFAGLTSMALAALALIPAGLSAQRTSDDDWLRDCREPESRSSRAVFCDVRVERVAAGRTLRIDAGQNGGIRVVGSNRSDVEVHARIQVRAETENDAQDIAKDVELRLEPGSISSRGPSTGRRESWSVTFVVYVPTRTDLDLSAHNGPVGIDDVSGAIEATTVNGPLSLSGVAGDVTARTQNGPLNIDLTGSRWDGEGLDAETRNGPVHLSVPDGYSAQLETGTVNGPFDTEVPLTVTQLGRVNRRIESKLGSGGARVRAITTNGPVVIRRR
jgi:DUF4097 and DUF4098 domain-containing protein YvlB